MKLTKEVYDGISVGDEILIDYGYDMIRGGTVFIKNEHCIGINCKNNKQNWMSSNNIGEDVEITIIKKAQ